MPYSQAEWEESTRWYISPKANRYIHYITEAISSQIIPLVRKSVSDPGGVVAAASSVFCK